MSKVYKNNAAVEFSLAKGDKQVVGGVGYRGKNPEYKFIESNVVGVPGYWVKSAKGIPFVRADRLTEEPTLYVTD